MTETYPYALPLMNEPRTPSKNLTNLRPSLLARPGTPAPRPARASAQALTLSHPHADGQILFGLGVLIIPAIAYSMMQMWSLVSGGSLDHAIRAFLP